MRIVITGADGMLGRDLQEALKNAAELSPLAHSECDIADPTGVQLTFAAIKPQMVINCAAYTDVDGCERFPERAEEVNARGAGNVARAAAAVGARVWHISTDYVFDGEHGGGKTGLKNESGAGWRELTEADAANPLSTYGRSKLTGEREVLALGNPTGHLVIRTSWLYGLHRVNFIDRVVEQALKGASIKAVSDQVSCLTWTRNLASAIARLYSSPSGRSATGILHLAGSGMSTRLENAQHVIRWLKAKKMISESIEVISTTWAALHLPARRPAFSAMTSSRFAELGIEALPDWRSSLDEYLELRVKSSS